MEPYVPAYEKLGAVPNRMGSRLPNSTPNNLYPTKEGGHIHITAGSMRVWERMARVMGREDLLDDPKFAEQVSLNANEDEVDEIVGEWTARYPLDEIEKLLEDAGVPAARIYTIEDIFEDPHYAAREMIVDVPDDDLGSVKLANVVPKLSETPGKIQKSGGQTGVDTAEVLRERLGLDEAAIAELEAAGVVYCGAGHDPAKAAIGED
jgi:crotonobetainyl-CoA:carnitine CoA-transferase CaiB-like acyl-CoA transferase